MKQTAMYLIVGGCLIIAIFLLVTFFKVILSFHWLIKIALLAIIIGVVLLLKILYDERTEGTGDETQSE